MEAAESGVPLEGRGNELTYSEYLHLDELLHLQVSRSESHDEALFIVVHQTSELWLKLCLQELRAARQCIAADDVRPAFKMLARVAGIQKQLIHSWDVLSTMTPSEYLAFRDALGTSSGFQSLQYRLVEFLLGNKGTGHVERFRADAAACASLVQELSAPSLYDEALRLLKRRGLPLPDVCIERDLATPASEQVSPALLHRCHRESFVRLDGEDSQLNGVRRHSSPGKCCACSPMNVAAACTDHGLRPDSTYTATLSPTPREHCARFTVLAASTQVCR